MTDSRPASSSIARQLLACISHQFPAADDVNRSADMQARHAQSATGNRHVVDQYRTAANAAAKIDVISDFDDTFEHVAQVGCDGHFLDACSSLPFSTQKPAAPRE